MAAGFSWAMVECRGWGMPTGFRNPGVSFKVLSPGDVKTYHWNPKSQHENCPGTPSSI